MSTKFDHTILVRYAEIALKGANRRMFEDHLRDNIISALGFPKSQVRKRRGQIAIKLSADKVEEATGRLKKIFGIAWFAITTPCESKFEEIVRACVKAGSNTITSQTTFAVRAHRSYKQLGFSSNDIERKVGAEIQAATGATVDLSNPDITVYAAIAQEGSYVYSEKISGPGGLPVGSSGKTLALLSGGFDSIAAVYYLAKRGARVDYLHFHAFPDAEQVLSSKIVAIIKKLQPWTLSNRLFLASYFPFEMKVWSLDEREQRFELVTFRRLMVKAAELLAKQHGYQGLILGDSLGQVASQTMENIAAVDEIVTLPIFRPLIGMDKVEVIQLIQQLDMFAEATADYKDCCSIIARNPAIRAHMPTIHQLEEKIGIAEILDEVVGAVEVVQVNEMQGSTLESKTTK